jgi:hypothetical protein
MYNEFGDNVIAGVITNPLSWVICIISGCGCPSIDSEMTSSSRVALSGVVNINELEVSIPVLLYSVGTSVYPLLALVAAGDAIEITGIRHNNTKIKRQKYIMLFIEYLNLSFNMSCNKSHKLAA